MKEDRTELLYSCLARRILVLDGAMGTMLQSFHPEEADFRGSEFADHLLPLKGDNDVLCLTRPDMVRSVHVRYLEAGADIIETNSFNANKISQIEYGLSDQVRRIACAAASVAASAAAEFTRKDPERPRFVAGSVGPTGRTLSVSPDVTDPAKRDVTFDEMVDSYVPAVEGLMEGGADILLAETIFDTLNAKAFIVAAEQVFRAAGRRIPLMFSGTVSDASGRLLAGQNPEAFLISVLHAPGLLSVGFNCALGAAEMRPYIEELAAKAPCLVSTHPNAGLPDELGHYRQTPEQMAEVIGSFAREGLINIAGGCCGTNPDFIRAIAEAVRGVEPRRVPAIAKKLRLSGLDPVVVSDELPFLQVGERCNVAGSRKFLNLMKAGDWDQGLRIARTQVENGAQIVDVNMDDAMLDAESCMRTFLLNLASDPDVARVPVMIDSSRWNVIRAGLRCVQGKCIVNSISLKEGEAAFLEKAREARSFGAAILCMAFDENGQADTVERRIAVCRRMYRLLTEQANVPPEDIVFDTNVFAVATGMPEHDSCARDFIESVRILKQEMPLCSFSGGISNVSFSFRGNEPVRRALHCVFLHHAIRAGLGMGIVNPAQLDIYDEIDPDLRSAAEAVILNTSPDAGERLLAAASALRDRADGSASSGAGLTPAWRTGTLEERLKTALIRGDDAYLEPDLAEAREHYPRTLDIIEGPLMDGMREAGVLFGEGKMFLPQIVKTARTMKKAVDMLTPYLSTTAGGRSSGTVVLATVKGDVHDIGKNIVSVILRCNNYRVLDLGVMVPCEKILSEAQKEHADAVLLSGLITPSLAEMEHAASEMQRLKFRIPLFVGGATTSREHAALKIQPLYNGPCVHTRDASAIVPILNDLLNPEKREETIRSIRREYGEILEEREHRENKTLSSEEARARSGGKTVSPSPVPVTLETKVFEPAVEELLPFFSRGMFEHLWGLDRHPDTGSAGSAKRDLARDAESILKRACAEHLLVPRGVGRILPASPDGETVSLFFDPERRNEAAKLVFPRRLRPLPDGRCPSLADFLAPGGDYLGMFALGIFPDPSPFKDDEYASLILSTLAQTLAEAFAEYLHRTMRADLWGFGDEALSRKDMFRGEAAGIRAAPGYPSCPDHSLKKDIFRLLDAEKRTGLRLTESCMIQPQSGIAAFLFASPESFYY